MLAVDTNIVVQLLTGRDPDQAAVARSIFDDGAIWIARSVFLETAWVLKSVYGKESTAIRDSFVSLTGLVNVYVENKPSFLAALALVDSSVDLSDAIHLSSRPEGASLVTFDEAFVKRAKRAGVRDISSA